MATFYKDDNKILVRDLNRYRKIYRYIRKKPRPMYCEGDEISHFQWGTYFVDFNNQSKVTHSFPCCYTSPPIVVAVSVETATGGPLGNINTFISRITSEEADFETSDLFTGRVHYHALIAGAYSMPNIGKKLEAVAISFVDQDWKEYSWTASFSCIPIVTATSNEDVNVFVTSITKTKVRIEVSQANFTGKVHLIGLERGC